MFHASGEQDRAAEYRWDGVGSNVARIFLTFDDGPDPVWTPKVLEALRSVDAKATFFVMTPLARRFPRLISDMVRAGHEIGLHCARHIRHTDLTRGEVEADVRAGLRDLGHLGITPRLWRPPWGTLAPWTAAVATGHWLDLVSWTADTHDWRGDGAQAMLEAVSPALGPDAVVLMHDGLGPGARRSGCEETTALIGPLVEWGRSLGCEPAAMGTGAASVSARREAIS